MEEALASLEAILRESPAAGRIRPGLWLGAYSYLRKIAFNVAEIDRAIDESGSQLCDKSLSQSLTSL